MAKIQVKTPVVELDGTPEVTEFGAQIEKAVIACIEAGIVTTDRLPLIEPRPGAHQSTEGFIDAVAARLKGMLR